MSKEAFTLFLQASHKLPHFFDLEPETIMAILQVTAAECEKILACQSVLYGYEVFDQFHIFQKAVLVFNDRLPDFSVHQEITPAEIAWAIMTMRMIDPVYPFDAEILAYIAVILHEEGLVSVPHPLEKERSPEDLSIMHFLEDINQNDAPLSLEAELVQRQLQILISNYVRHRKDKLLAEIEVMHV